MADINWSPSSDLSSFYMGRMAPPIKLPDGTYIPTPNVLSVDQIYQGILPPSVPSTPLVSRSVNTVPVDSNGIAPEALAESLARCDYVYVTPSHQCPNLRDRTPRPRTRRRHKPNHRNMTCHRRSPSN